MARVTVEDCLQKTNNRFDLVILAARRARQLELTANRPMVQGSDKKTVLALREIADGLIDHQIIDKLENSDES